jgi:hypothetical protein
MNRLRDLANAAYYAIAIAVVVYSVRAELRDGIARQRAAIEAKRAEIDSRAEAFRSRLPFARSIRDELIREEFNVPATEGN